MLSYLTRFLPSMASNHNRFIPPYWLRMAQASGPTRSPYPLRPRYPLASVGYYYYAPYCYYYQDSRMPMVSYQTYGNLQRTAPQNNEINQDGNASSRSRPTRYAKKDGTCHETQNSNESRQTVSTQRNQRTEKSYGFTGKSTPPSRQYRKQPPARHHHSFRSYSDRPQGKVPSASAAPVRPDKVENESMEGTSEVDSHGETRNFDQSRLRLERKWEDIEPPDNFQDDTRCVKKRIRVVSYNILSQKLLDLNSHLYRKCNPDALPWDYRWPKLKREIQEFDADVLCLQEVEECHYNTGILQFLESLQYECHYKKRTGNNDNKPDGVVVAFKTCCFEICKRMKVEYKRGDMPPLNQDNVAVVTLLKQKFQRSTKVKKSHLCVVNTHLLYNPRRGDIKLAQLSTLFSEIHHMLSGFDANIIPIILCGDFNSTPGSHLFNFITTQELNYQGLQARHISGQKDGSKGRDTLLPHPLMPKCAQISENGCLRIRGTDSTTTTEEDRFVLYHSIGPLSSAHTHSKLEASTTQDKGVTVDYVFHTPFRNRGAALYPIQRLSLIQPEDLLSVQGIPNAVHPSDHLPIVVDFAMVHQL